jgi:hypothetical protein
MNPTDEQSPHRLFAAIVLMGSSLAAGCGGISAGEGPVDAAGHSGVATGGTASTSSGAGPSVGAATSTSGSSNTDIGPILSVGGSVSAPEPIEPGPFQCPPEQWTCGSPSCDGSYGGWVLPDGCACDPNKPLRASDCQPDQLFVCKQATVTVDGRPLTKPVPLSCTCVPRQMYFCNTECDIAYGQANLTCYGAEDQLSATCGCAVVYLK